MIAHELFPREKADERPGFNPLLPQPMTTPRIVPCPTCGAEVIWGPQSPHRPFCSERCRKIDLGAWASDSYRVPGDATPDEFDLPETTPRPRE